MLRLALVVPWWTPFLQSLVLRIFALDLFRDMAAPIATPTAIPTASQKPPVPRATAKAAPIPAPSAIPRPICIDGLFISKTSTPQFRSKRGASTNSPHYELCRGRTFLAVIGRRKHIGFWRVVSDEPHLGEQFVHTHSGKRFKQGWNLRCHLGNVAGNFVHAGGVAISGGDDRDLIHVGQRTGQRPHDFR